jgi:SAM-dependent methyltransferase
MPTGLALKSVDGPRQWKECPVCDAADSSVYVEFDVLTFAQCSQCRVVFKSREIPDIRPDGFYEADYFLKRKSRRDKRFEHRVRKAGNEILLGLEELPTARSVLDVGCSLGYVIEAGKRLGLDAAGLDVSEYAVQICRERGYRAERGSLERLPFENAEFDLIVMKHVLEHTPEPKRAMAEVRRVLNRNGAVVIAVPELRYWKGDFLRRTYRYFRPDDLGQQHYVYFTEETLTQLLKSCGFVVRSVSKAVLRRRLIRGPWSGLYERARYFVLRAKVAVASALRLQREVFLVAQRQP